MTRPITNIGATVDGLEQKLLYDLAQIRAAVADIDTVIGIVNRAGQLRAGVVLQAAAFRTHWMERQCRADR